MILDTAIAIHRIRNGEDIDESITVVSLIEFPYILEYAGFNGKVIFPTLMDYFLAYDIQRRLMSIGKMKGFADILISSITINNNEELVTSDSDFLDIARVSPLKVSFKEI